MKFLLWPQLMNIYLVLNHVHTASANVHRSGQNDEQRPHIIFILADDLGFNDVGFHGSAQIPTPNIDALAFSGVILNRYYVNPICTPSRSALMTGKYPIHTGMQHTVLYAPEPRGLPLSEKILPQYLNELGYSSHIAGKWHLGHYKHVYTPLYRGFSSHVGYWTGHQDYNDHYADDSGLLGLDARIGMNVAHELHGKYTTDLITDEALRVIAEHNSTKQPLFLYVAHAAVHSANPYNPLPAPDETVAKMKHIDHYGRRRYAAVLSKLDDSVGKIVQQLQHYHMLNNSIIIFSTDNGGPAEGFNLNHASNWPLRGVKNTLWEGGVRGAAFLWYSKWKNMRRVSEQTMHIADWLPTLLSAVGGDEALRNISTPLDGISIWNALANDEVSPRRSVLHNIDDIWGSAALTMGHWKLIKGSHYKGAWDGWYGPAGDRNPESYDIKILQRSLAGRALSSLRMLPSNAEIVRLRRHATVNCGIRPEQFKRGSDCEPLKAPCLFNVQDDPCEFYDMAEIHPNILTTLLRELERINATAVPPSNKPNDPKADPRLWHYTWTNWGDYEDVENLLSS